jgi:Ni/Co efflux regulator RcnB
MYALSGEQGRWRVSAEGLKTDKVYAPTGSEVGGESYRDQEDRQKFTHWLEGKEGNQYRGHKDTGKFTH